jgi:hypothetical protein
MLENDALQNQMLQTERDTIDVITFLKKEDAVKDNHVCLIVPYILRSFTSPLLLSTIYWQNKLYFY